MLKDNITTIELFFRSSSFYRSIIVTLAVISPIALGYFFNYFSVGESIAIGVLLSSPGNIPGSLKRRVNGILISIGLTMVITLLILLVENNLWLLITVLGFLSFCISLITVYGFRGSLISFSGLFAIVLAFSKPRTDISEIITHVGLIGIGGFWFLTLALLFYFISSKKDEDQLLSETLDLTGNYLKIRGKIILEKNRRQLQNKLLKLETQISENHEVLREILLVQRKTSGRSHFDEKRLLIFISLVDILELALANTVDYKKLDQIFEGNESYLKPFGELNRTMGKHLQILSELIINKGKIPDKNQMVVAKNNALVSVESFTKDIGLPKSREGALTLRNLFDYQENVINEVIAIRRAMANVKNASQVSLKSQEAKFFITHQEYSLSIIKENINFQSPIFRHSLRLSVAMIIGFLIGYFIDIQNAYWVLLTIVVIMRPNYGLTKERSINRVIGTLIGAALAIIIILLTQNIYVYILLAVISFLFSFSFIQQSYKTGAAFITITIIFIYAIAVPNAYDVVKFRIIDTAIGAAIAIAVNYLIWPNWEFMNIKNNIAQAIAKNNAYLLATKEVYQSKKITEVKYKVPRKEAFLALSNLNASFERLTNDPKSKQKEYELIYEIVTLNHTILSAIASLGGYIQTHKTTVASQQFSTIVDFISNNLHDAKNIINQENKKLDNITSNNISEAESHLLMSYNSLIDKRDTEIKEGKYEIQKEQLLDLQEAHLIYNQLLWLKSLSGNLKKATQKYTMVFA